MQPNSVTRQPFISTRYSERTHLKTAFSLYLNPLNPINWLRMVTHQVSSWQNPTFCPLTDDKRVLRSASLVVLCAVCVMCNVSGIFCTSYLGCRQLLCAVLHWCDVAQLGVAATEILNRTISDYIISYILRFLLLRPACQSRRYVQQSTYSAACRSGLRSSRKQRSQIVITYGKILGHNVESSSPEIEKKTKKRCIHDCLICPVREASRYFLPLNFLVRNCFGLTFRSSDGR